MNKKKFTHWAKTYDEAIELLSTNKVREVSFDHDLGDDGLGARLKTGYDIACWVEERAKENTIPRMLMSVHSANPVGAANISRAINQCFKFWDEHNTQLPNKELKPVED